MNLFSSLSLLYLNRFFFQLLCPNYYYCNKIITKFAKATVFHLFNDIVVVGKQR